MLSSEVNATVDKMKSMDIRVDLCTYIVEKRIKLAK